MTISIKAEFLAGTDIETAITEAISLSMRLGVAIQINFNGCHLRLHPFDKVPEKVKEYHRELKLLGRTV